jgi:hypothetical protein
MTAIVNAWILPISSSSKQRLQLCGGIPQQQFGDSIVRMWPSPRRLTLIRLRFLRSPDSAWPPFRLLPTGV